MITDPKLPIPRYSALVALVSAVLLGLAAAAYGGVNQGGTLVAHDAGLIYTAEVFTYPSVAPSACDLIDTELPIGLPAGGSAWIWKVYAAFPTGAHPRLKALAFGAIWDPAQIKVLNGSVPDPYWDFQVPDDDWPYTPESGVGVSLMQAGTGIMTEVYWIAGYAYGPSTWTLRPHHGQPAIFVDDAFPPNEDPIAAFGSIGFGLAGSPACPVPLGACCLGDGLCRVLSEAECRATAGVEWGAGISCSPYPCTGLPGACCLPDGECVLVTSLECARLEGIPRGAGVECEAISCPPPEGACCEASGYCFIWNRDACLAAGSTFIGPRTVCTPNPCVQPVEHGACCLASGQCVLLSTGQCQQIAGNYLGDGTVCLPNPCPQPIAPGACCLANGTCLIRDEGDCLASEGLFQGVGVSCGPNPCPQPEGACCLTNAACEVLTAVGCQLNAGTWMGPGVPCAPTPCDTIPGACCASDGSCQLLPQAECGGVFLDGDTCDPNPCLVQLGACCYFDGSCLLMQQGVCLANGGFYWWEGLSCAPNPCDAALRVEETNWGRIKLLFRR